VKDTKTRESDGPRIDMDGDSGKKENELPVYPRSHYNSDSSVIVFISLVMYFSRTSIFFLNPQSSV
jgi:hypothetical protein